ncbi:nuclear protein [Crepidotus variabilis]|uniref:Nuclear protein n=1 Tax=Crepidotus variabilis TaxID=179855 RepID=A0A9P6EDY9_9AGAR|nr:nuclear protein [Crepidotus variabilis]
MATKATKILTVGAAIGSISELFAKIKAIDIKHGKFDLVLCTGDFFGLPSEESELKSAEVAKLISGELEVPIECYVMQGEYPLPPQVVEKFAKTGGELCKNVFLMSKSGIITTANGLRIACLGGSYDPQIYATAEAAPGFMSPFFSHHTVDRLLSNTLSTTSSTSSQKQKSNFLSLASIQAMSLPSQLIDILITNSWPYGANLWSQIVLPDSQLANRETGAPPLNDIIQKTKPRYHFAAGGPASGHPSIFWEREPYVWDDEKGRVSRFVGLGGFGAEPVDGKKQRWFYAFTISPNNPTETPARPPNATRNPFLEGGPRPPKRQLNNNTEGGENFIFGNIQQPNKRSRVAQTETGKPPPGYKCRRCESTEVRMHRNLPAPRAEPTSSISSTIVPSGQNLQKITFAKSVMKNEVGDTGGKKPKPGYVCLANQRAPQGERRSKRGPLKEIAPDECWFCLSNPNLAKHLIVAIGAECYVTLPKGQIIPTQSAAEQVDVPGGGHVLIVPITHYPTFSTIPTDLALPILDETEQYKKALSSLYSKYGCVPVIFEVARLSAKGGHAHVQAVPVPRLLKDKIEPAFVKEGLAQGIDFEEDPESGLAECANGRGGYFRVDLPDGRKMVHVMKENVPFNLQFGRHVIVGLLGIPDRLDWKACMLSEGEDRADAQAFKTAFASFDPAT